MYNYVYIICMYVHMVVVLNYFICKMPFFVKKTRSRIFCEPHLYHVRGSHVKIVP